MPEQDIEHIGAQFANLGRFVDSARLKVGHIHDTFIGVYDLGFAQKRYVHQRMNKYVFKDPVKMVENIQRITEHQRSYFRENGTPDLERHALNLLPTVGGELCYQDSDGEFWRTFDFIEGARTYDTGEDPEMVFEAAAAFGQFQRIMASFDASLLTDTIPGFHDIPARYTTLRSAIDTDLLGRTERCRGQIERSEQNADIVERCRSISENQLLPQRVVHNDTKVNNVMIDDTTRKAICVIDLDTCMSDLAIHDFGQLVRTSATTAREDETNLETVGVDMELFQAICRGYLSEAREFLTDAEKEHLVFSALVMTYENAIRFLSDYLTGDKYFKINYPEHNLDRANNQFELLRKLRATEDQLETIVFEEAK